MEFRGHPELAPSQRFGGYGGGETPGPIPNPEVKPSRADGTALETGWESRSLPEHLLIEAPKGASMHFRLGWAREPPTSWCPSTIETEGYCREGPPGPRFPVS